MKNRKNRNKLRMLRIGVEDIKPSDHQLERRSFEPRTKAYTILLHV